MNYKAKENVKEFKAAIKELCRDWHDYLINNAEDDAKLKHSALLYYWLKDFKSYIKMEKTFLPKYLPAYQRGNIILADFGYNLGSELGGLHFAIVLQNSSKNNNTVFVAPLSSIKPDKKLLKSQVDIGTDIVKQICTFNSAKIKSIMEELEFLDSLSSSHNYMVEIENRIVKLQKQRNYLTDMIKRIKTFSTASTVLCNQIRPISKIRIKEPLNNNHALLGIKISANILKEIDKKIIDLYTLTKVENI